MDQDNENLTPDLDNEERKKLGLIYYKPVSKELKVDFNNRRAKFKNRKTRRGICQAQWFSSGTVNSQSTT